MTQSLSPQHALSTLQHCELPLLILDRKGQVLEYNKRFENLVGQAQLTGLLGRSYALLGDHPARCLLGDESRVCWQDRDERMYHFEVQTIELPDADQVQARLYIDVSAQVELEEARSNLSQELEQQVLTDRNTGLLNERGILLALEPQVARSRRYNSTMSVMVLDTHCHTDIGSVHPHIARLLKDQLRWADLIGFGDAGDFILVLPETGTDAAIRLLEKLRLLLDRLAANTLAGKSLSTRAGIASWCRNDSAATLLARARTALSQTGADNSDDLVAL